MASLAPSGEGRAAFAARVRWIALPLAIFLVTRLTLICVVWASQIVFPSDSSQPGSPLADRLALAGWVRWDAWWYLRIVHEGYGIDPTSGQSSVAFFPLYPLLIRGLRPVLGDPAVVGLFVSNALGAPAVVLLYDLVARRHGRDVASRAAILLCVQPFGFYSAGLQTESTYLFATVLAFWLAERNRWAAAGLAGALASLTRQMGLVMVPALGILYLFQWLRGQRKLGPAILTPGLVFLGIGGYAAFLWWEFGDPLAFYNATVGAWGHFSLWSESLAQLNPVAMPLRDTRIFLTVNLALAILWLAAVVPTSRQLGPAYAVFLLLSVLIPLNVGLVSLGRYLTVAFPAPIIAALYLKRPNAFTLVVGISALWQGAFAVLFAAGYPLY